MLLIAAAAAGGPPHFMAEAAALIVGGAVIAYLASRLGLVPIAGFLLAGVVIGPHALGLVGDQAMVDAIAELGVVLLLFTIGIEFSLEKLVRIKRVVFVGGGLQVALAVAATAGLLLAVGVGWREAVFTGMLVSLSSTAIVLKLLSARGDTGTPAGQVALGVLVFQDLAVIVMVLLVPLLAGGGGGPGQVALELGRAVGIIAVVLLVARKLMPPVLEAVARTCSPELFLLSVVALCFGTAYLTSLAGVSLSLGAFLAGLVVSESRFSEHALGEILPLQILFSATFFVSVGMLLDLEFLVRSLPLVLAGAALVVGVKTLTTAAGVAALGRPAGVVAASALTLAQIGEFSFVMERAGRDAGLAVAGLGEAGPQVFIAVSVLLMLATPGLSALGSRLAARVERGPASSADEPRAGTPAAVEEEMHSPAAGMENHVVVAGYGDAARRLVRVLERSGVPFVITTLNPAGAREAEDDRLPVMRGDATRQRTLLLAGVDRAKMLVIADDDPATAYRIASVARTTNPTMRILVRTRYIADVEEISAVGADRVVADELESVVQLFGYVLQEYRVGADEIVAYEEEARSGGYALLRGRSGAALGPCALGEDCFSLRTVRVRQGMPVVGRTARALEEASDGAFRVRDVLRGGLPAGPPDEAAIQPGDELVLEGSAEAFARHAELFRGGVGAAEVPRIREPPVRADWIDTEAPLTLDGGPGCAHTGQARTVFPGSRGCEECLRDGSAWVHLRVCMTCGHVGCCDSSPNKHATAHFHATRHPIIRSLEPGEAWAWCFVDGRMV